jgi:hypothetical protein
MLPVGDIIAFWVGFLEGELDVLTPIGFIDD